MNQTLMGELTEDQVRRNEIHEMRKGSMRVIDGIHALSSLRLGVSIQCIIAEIHETIHDQTGYWADDPDVYKVGNEDYYAAIMYLMKESQDE